MNNENGKKVDLAKFDIGKFAQIMELGEPTIGDKNNGRLFSIGSGVKADWFEDTVEGEYEHDLADTYSVIRHYGSLDKLEDLVKVVPRFDKETGAIYFTVQSKV